MREYNGQAETPLAVQQLGEAARDMIRFWGGPGLAKVMLVCGHPRFGLQVRELLREQLLPAAEASGFDTAAPFERLAELLAATLTTVLEATVPCVMRPDVVMAGWNLVWHGLRSRTVNLPRRRRLLDMRGPALPSSLTDALAGQPDAADLTSLLDVPNRLYLTQGCLLLAPADAWCLGWLLTDRSAAHLLLSGGAEDCTRWPEAFRSAARRFRLALISLLVHPEPQSA